MLSLIFPPGLAFDDVANIRSRHAVLMSQLGVIQSIGRESAYLPNNLPAQLAGVLQPSPVVRATLGQHVLHVVSRRPEKQMLGVTALRVVALVANKHPLRDIAHKRLVRSSMSPHLSRVLSRHRITTDVAVALLVPTALKLPAASLDVAHDFLEEPVVNRPRFLAHSHQISVLTCTPA